MTICLDKHDLSENNECISHLLINPIISEDRNRIVGIDEINTKNSLEAFYRSRTMNRHLASCNIARKEVTFDKINIRSYSMELGDNPSCSSGPPLTISWSFDDHASVSVDEFEHNRPPRRSACQMVIPDAYRSELLQEKGYSLSQIIKATKEVDLDRDKRERSSKSNNGKIEEVFEKTNRKLKRIFIRRRQNYV